MPYDSPPHINRDRHGRGLRGPTLPHNAPSYETSAQLFTRLVREAIEDLDERFPTSMTHITFLTEEVPSLRDLTLHDGVVALGRVAAGNPHECVLYRRPIEWRSPTDMALSRTIRDVLAENVGLLLGMRPENVDPDYYGPRLR